LRGGLRGAALTPNSSRRRWEQGWCRSSGWRSYGWTSARRVGCGDPGRKPSDSPCTFGWSGRCTSTRSCCRSSRTTGSEYFRGSSRPSSGCQSESGRLTFLRHFL